MTNRFSDPKLVKAPVAIGVLALQGDFAEHATVLRSLGADVLEVRLPRDLEQVGALVMPGGESTTIARLMDLYELREPIKRRAHEGMAVWGTCAGMIMMADRLTNNRPEPLHLMDITVTRNAYGRQVDSFESDLDIQGVAGPPFRAVFIRAPGINTVGPRAKAVATLPDGRVVAVRQDNLFATAFHPELTSDNRIHRYFLDSLAAVSVQKRR